MNKKLNTFVFIIGATLINVLLIMVLLIGLILLAGVLFSEPSDALAQALLIGSFLLSLVGAFAIYSRIIKMISKRIDMDKYFHPIFKPKKRGDGENGRMLK